MNVKTEKIDKNRVKLEVEVPAEKLNEGVNKAYKKIVKQVNIPGFRKGKAPQKMVENIYGIDVLLGEAAEILVPELYPQAVEEAKIDPIDSPKIDVEQMEAGKPFVFTAEVEVKPEVTLGEYKGIKSAKLDIEVTAEDVKTEMERKQAQFAKVVELDETAAVENGDIAEISFEGFVDGKAFQGGKSDSHPLEIGSGTFIPGFEEQVIGMKIGEDKDIEVQFPENYSSEELKGKPATFKVNVKGIKRKELKPLDDEFAKDVSEFETLTEMEADVKATLEKTAAETAENEKKENVIKQIVENAEVEIPQVMIDTRVESMVKEFTTRLQYQGMDVDQYLAYADMSMEQLKANYVNDAESGVKSDLVLEAVAKAEALEVSEADVEEYAKDMAEKYNQDIETIKKTLLAGGRMDSIKYNILLNKVIDFVMQNSIEE